MKALDLFKISFVALKARKLRASLTILGVIIGTATVVALISQTQGLMGYVTEQVNKAGVSTIFIFPEARTVTLSLTDVENIRRMQGVKYVTPFIRGFATLTVEGASTNLMVIGIDNEMLPVIFKDLTVFEGNLLSAYDYVGMVVGYKVAKPPGSEKAFASIGQLISVKTTVVVGGELSTSERLFRVEGVLSEYGAALFLPIDEAAFTSLPAASILFRKHYYDGIIVIAETVNDVDPIMEMIQRVYGEDVRAISPSQILESFRLIMSQIELFLGSIAAISLLVAGIGIANIMYISVYERIRVIGLFKALGTKSRTILMLFLVEAMWIGLIGGVLGCLIGAATSQLIGAMLFGGGVLPWNIQPVFTPELITMAIGFALLISIVAGFYPALKAAKLDPVASLRHE